MAQNDLATPLAIYNADETPFYNLALKKYAVENVVMSLGDKISGDIVYPNNSLVFTLREYVVYNNVRYYLVNPPSITRDGTISDGASLNGATKYSLVFYHPMVQLGSIPFTDVAVTSDETKYLSQNKTFSWTGKGVDFIKKINKNLQGTEWVIVLSENQESIANLYLLPDEVDVTKAGGKENESILTFDKNFIGDALKTTYDTWKVPFVIDSLHKGEYYYTDEHGAQRDYYDDDKRFVILFGNPTNEIYEVDEHGEPTTTPYIFKMGQGLGLKNNTRTPRNNKIVTRIVGCGSERNIPYGYPQIPWYGDETWDYTINNNPNAVGSYPIYKGIYNGKWVKLIKHPFTRKTLVPTVYRNTLFNKVSPYLERQERTPIYSSELEYTLYQIDTLIAQTEYQTEESALLAMRRYLLQLVDNPSLGSKQGSGTGWSCVVNIDANNIATGSIDYQVGIESWSYWNINPTYAVIEGYREEDPIPNPNFNPNIEIVDYYDADNTYPNPINVSAPSVEIHDFESVYPRFGKHGIVGVLPYDDTKYVSKADFLAYINRLIASDTINEWERTFLGEVYNDIDVGLTPFWEHTVEPATVKTTGRRKTYVDGYWYDVYFISQNINFHHRVYLGQRSPSEVVEWTDEVDGEGKYKQDHFKLTIPVLDFDLYACASITEKMDIYMRSGDCIGCTFQVDIDWDYYKQNFYDGNGNFVPYGEQRNYEDFPDTSQQEVSLIVLKDNETFGMLLPNQYQMPKQGDEFVILGISLPYQYVNNAEIELDNISKEYMRENNIHYFEYPLKFDEYFLATNQGILRQVRNNTAVHFQFGNELPMALFIKQITIRYGDKPLPQYDITLTDDIEIVLNKLGQVTEDVSRMNLQVFELRQYYSENIVAAINDKLSKTADDVAQGRITFQQGLLAVGNVVLDSLIQSSNFNSGLHNGKGWRIDELGNTELESLRVRSYLEVVELLVNRMQGQDGDNIFTENDQIEKVDVSEINGTTVYTLSLKKKYDGYVTGQQYGNILLGKINTLAAEQSGISNETENNPDKQGVDMGGNLYYTSYIRVVGTVAQPFGDTQLRTNQIQVVMYGDNEVPSRKNFAPCVMMNIARVGCVDYSAEHIGDEDYENIVESIRRRQSFYVISSTNGRIEKFTGVATPIIENYHYGVTLGDLPEFVQEYANVRERYLQGRDYLYAQGVVVGDFIKIDTQGRPITNVVFCGDWVDGSVNGSVTFPSYNPKTGVTTQITKELPIPSTELTNKTSDYIGHGIYLYNEYNANTQQYETHQVRHNGGLWQCLQHQPVTIGGVTTYFEPKFGSPYWQLVDADNILHIEIETSDASSFARGHVSATFIPHLYLGNVDITEETEDSAWSWYREMEVGKSQADEDWDDDHEGIKELSINNTDIPSDWSVTNRVKFSCKVQVNNITINS